MPDVMRAVASLGGLDDRELRATFNGGLGMVVVVEAAAVPATLRALGASGVPAALVGEVVTIEELDGARYAEGPLAG
jgi:phosphoribosylformylglycinamidine cyclo-ligase